MSSPSQGTPVTVGAEVDSTEVFVAEYYRTVFTIEDRDITGLDLLDLVSDSVKSWFRDETGWPVNGPSGTLEDDEQQLVFGGDRSGDLGQYRVAWERLIDDVSDATWRLSVRLATESGDLEADIEVRGVDGVSSPLFRADPPGVVHTLLSEFQCTISGRRISAMAKKVPIDESPALLGELLDPDRRLPAIVVSEEGDRGAAIDPDHLQHRLLGMATVFSYDHDVAWLISKDLPRSLRCYDGAIRLYSPGCSEMDVPQQHPYWVPADIEKLSDERMISILRDECVSRLPRLGRQGLYSRVSGVIQREEVRLFAQYIELIEKQQIGDDALFDAVMSMGNPGSNDNAEVNPPQRRIVRGIVGTFKNRNNMLREENSRLRIQLKEAQTELRKFKRTSADDLESNQPDNQAEAVEDAATETVLETVERAGRDLTGLRFLETSIASARAVTRGGSFMRTADLYRLFEVMSECAERRSIGGLGMGIEDWFSYQGVDYAKRESTTTQARYGAARMFTDERTGNPVSMPAHFKLKDSGFQLRVHVRWISRENTWLIGHVGEHLSTASDPH